MARLVGVDLPRDKRLEVALTYIYGVGRTRAQETLAATGVSPDLRVREVVPAHGRDPPDHPRRLDVELRDVDRKRDRPLRGEEDESTDAASG